MNRAAVYCRISRDPEGVKAGVTRQEEDARALAEREGLEVTRVYTDNDTGASSLSRKPRPEYAAMMAAARTGEFDTIVAYSNSRLTRRLRELEDLLELHEKHGVSIRTVVSGSDDLSTADGRMTARIKASVDAAEAERSGERIRRAHLQRAQAGTVHHGSRAFGWQDDKSTLDPVEADLIRKAAADILDGVGLRAIVREWNDKGIRTARGNDWDHRALRQMLKGPRLAGWRVHQGEVARDATGAPVRGVWEPILTPEHHERVVAALMGRAGAGGRRGSRHYLISGLARCGGCGARMYGAATPYGHNYGCEGKRDGKRVTINGVMTDEAVRSVVVARLREAGDLAHVPPVAAFAGDSRLSRIPEQIGELMGAYNEGDLSAAVVFPQVSALESEQTTLERERSVWAAENVRVGPSTADPMAFDGLDVDRQRAVCESLMEAIIIKPATARGARWTPDRITYVWRNA